MTCHADSVYLHAKLSALRSLLYRREDYHSLIHAGQAHRAFADCVSEQQGRSVYVSQQCVFAFQIRPVLRMLAASDYCRDLFLAFVRFFETDALKQVCARAYGRATAVDRWLDISPHHSFAAELQHADPDRATLQRLLANSYLQAAVAEGLPRSYEALENLFDVCMAAQFWQAAEGMPFWQRSRYRAIMAVRLYLQQCTWIDRLRHGYGWTDRQIEHHVSDADMCQLPHLAHALVAAGRSVPAVIARPARAVAEVADCEYAREQWFYGYARRRALHTCHTVVNATCYVWLLYYQLMNVFRIIEGFRFRLPPDAIAGRLICEA